jgi:hypothetical protein
MGKHKQVVCGKCCRVMRSNNLERHMKVHEKYHETETENIQSKENHDNRLKEAEEAELIKESIEVYKIYLLLQRMKTKPNPY